MSLDDYADCPACAAGLGIGWTPTPEEDARMVAAEHERMRSELRVGDRVVYAISWLRSTGTEHTLGHARGTLVELGDPFCRVCWDFDGEMVVHRSNIARKGTRLACGAGLGPGTAVGVPRKTRGAAQCNEAYARYKETSR